MPQEQEHAQEEYTETAAGEISTQTRVNLMKSLPLRFEACIEAKGDVIKS